MSHMLDPTVAFTNRLGLESPHRTHCPRCSLRVPSIIEFCTPASQTLIDLINFIGLISLVCLPLTASDNKKLVQVPSIVYKIN